MFRLNFLCAAFAAFFFSAFSWNSAQADVFYSDDFVSIPWPDDVPWAECAESVRAKAGVACRQIGENGSSGAVFMTMHEGYALGNRELLEKHLADSEGALENIPNVHVMQSVVYRENPVMGLMEIFREDGVLLDVDGLKDQKIRQSSLIIPTDNRLVQLFVYLSMDDKNAPERLSRLIETWSQQTVVHRAPIVPALDAPKKPDGALSLMPRALWVGGLIALIAILCVSIRMHLARARRRAEDRKLQIQLEACSNTQVDEDEYSDGEEKRNTEDL